MEDSNIDDQRSAVPFTARLIAHYRAMESKRENPLVIDPFAERLAGDMRSYFEDHKRTRGTGDYAIIRTYYIDNRVIMPWCVAHETSQIVLLGAGLDARAYRLDSLKRDTHSVFEIDFDLINRYKTVLLKKEKPFCSLSRVSADLSDPDWMVHLERAGFSYHIPTLWLLEGLAYYLDREKIVSVLKTAAMNCADKSQIFADVCVPGLALARFGPFMMYFKWGLEKENVPPFFAHCGWNVRCVYADEFDQGRDVGQRGLIFVTGDRDLSTLDGKFPSEDEQEIELLSSSELKSYSREFLLNIEPEIELIAESYKTNPDVGMSLYSEFITRIAPIIQRIIKSFPTPLSIGHISSRLLRDPGTVKLHTKEEKEAHLVGTLKAVLSLGYCGASGVSGDQFQFTNIYSEGLKIGSVDHLSSFAKLVQDETIDF
ncbi:MAG: class I SAM-dependent methyltransferase [Candidatus Thorarchaeota archaeon]